MTGVYQEEWVELVFTHSEIVESIAMRITEDVEVRTGISINRENLSTGALLHDIGVYRCYNEEHNPDKTLPSYLQHGLIGYELILNEGFPLAIARFAGTHTGVGFTKDEIIREALPLPHQDWIAMSLEEEIPCYADKFHTKYPTFSTFQRELAKLEKFSSDKALNMLKVKFGVPDIRDLEEQYKQWHKDFNSFYEKIGKDH